MRLFAALRAWLAACTLLVPLLGWAQDVLPVPPLSGRVIDQTGTLTAPQVQALSAKLAAVEQTHGAQVVVLVVPTTLPEDITSYGQRVGDQWKIGRKDVGDGLVIVVAKNDRKVRIEVAKALEGAIPDLMSKRVINEQIQPAFRAGDYAGGLNQAVDRLAALIANEGLPAPTSGQPGAGGFDWANLAVFLFIGAPVVGGVLSSVMGRKLGTVATGGAVGALGWWWTSSLLIAAGAGVLALLLVGVMGVGSRRGGGFGNGPVIWGGGGGGGSSGWGGGGGFGSGGGGDFGGGGASGDW